MIPKELLDEISKWISEKRYGNLKINFAAGKIMNVNREDSMKISALRESHIDR
jgi:hypothetical protein